MRTSADRQGLAHKGIDALVALLDRARPVVIQAHDFPDHDAVAAGYALRHLLRQRGVPAEFCYSGRIQSHSLSEAIKMLAIPLRNSSELELTEQTQIILVDGFVGNKNVTDLPGTVVALIDHHSPPEKPTVVYWDIRKDYGSTSTIIWSYFHEAKEALPPDCATSLLMGLMMDTAFMTRGVNQVDMDAFADLFFQADWQAGARLLKNSLSLADLAVFRDALNNCQVVDDFCFIPIQTACSPEVAALTADFFLNLHEIRFAVVLFPDEGEYRLSVRSADNQRPADLVIRKALAGIGSGGGHVHMGGGQVPRSVFPGEAEIRRRFLDVLNEKK